MNTLFPLITIGIAGSTSHTVQCVEALVESGKFSISWILTPPPKPIGRKQVLTKNALHLFAEQNEIPVIFVEKKIDQETEDQIKKFEHPAFLLVVDFGYLLPSWLLEWPKIAPLNIHPSALPQWRGSSPGQFVLLHGNHTSAVTLMLMDKGMDTGPILWQEPFSVEPNWTQTEYYHFSFDLMGKILSQKIVDFAEGKIQPQSQPAESPTEVARRLTKDDGFVRWKVIAAAIGLSQTPSSDEKPTSTLLTSVFEHVGSWPKVIVQGTKALTPWPGVWTIISTPKGQKRLNIIEASLDPQRQILKLDRVKIEGQETAYWNQVKNQVTK
jgi:methionyl-tRNA formyltransferase